MENDNELNVLVNLIVEWWIEDNDDAEFFNKINKYCPSVIKAFNEFYAKNSSHCTSEIDKSSMI